MFAFRDQRTRVDVAFTDRHGAAGAAMDLSRTGLASSATLQENLRVVAAAFASEARAVVGMSQVHGADVFVVDESYAGAEIVADGMVTSVPGVPLLVRAADCVPVLLADDTAGVVGVAHAGRPGMVAGVVPATIDAMRALGATMIEAWVGPHVCGSCYEVPEQMRADVCAVVPEAWAETSWGTPAVDIGAGVRAQLVGRAVQINDVERCTREDPDLWSFRRDGEKAGRLGGLIRVRP